MILTSNDQFRLHPDTCLPEGSDTGFATAGVFSLHENTGVPSNPLSMATAEGVPDGTIVLDQSVSFISDENPGQALKAVFRAVSADRAFCVIPAGQARGLVVGESGSIAGEANARSAESCLPHFQCLSSGTSGTARRIQRSHRSWINSFRVNASLMQIGCEDSYAVLGTLSHSLPLYAALEACYLGADVHLLSELRPDRQLDAMARLGTTVLYLTPTQARQLCAVKKADSRLRFRVRQVLCGGGKLDEKTRAALQRLFEGAGIVEFYGASETSFMTLGAGQAPSGSVGSVYPGVSIRILDEAGQPATGVGEIWIKSDYLFSGYAAGDWRDTRMLDGYLSIGEMGRFDESGNLYLSGRKSRQANVADNFVYLQEVEDVLMQHPAVTHCVVIARQDALRGETLMAVVEGIHDDSLQADILSFARRQLGQTLAPKDVLFLGNLPWLDAGKPDVRRIQSMVDRL